MSWQCLANIVATEALSKKEGAEKDKMISVPSYLEFNKLFTNNTYNTYEVIRYLLKRSSFR